MAYGGRLPVTSSVAFIYPRLLPMHTLDGSVGSLDIDGTPHLPTPMPLTLEKLEADGTFLMDDGVALYVWVGRGASPEFLQAVLQLPSLEGVDVGRLRLPPLDNEASVRVQRLLHAVRSQRPHVYQSVRVLTPKAELEGRFLSMLTEDRAQTAMSYVEFLCHVHRQIQQKFTNN